MHCKRKTKLKKKNKHFFNSILIKNFDNDTFISFFAHLCKLVLGSAYYNEEINFTLASLRTKRNIKVIFEKKISSFNELKTNIIVRKSFNIQLLKKTINYNKYFKNAVTNRKLAKKIIGRLFSDAKIYFKQKINIDKKYAENFTYSTSLFKALIVCLYIDYPKNKISKSNVDKYILPYIQNESKILFEKYYKVNDGFYLKSNINKSDNYFTERLTLNKLIISLLKK